MRSITSAVPLGIMVSALVSSPALASDTKAEKSSFSVSPPSGFEQLEAERELVLDVYYGGEKRGTARVAVFGDRIQFMDARQALSFIDDASPGSAIGDLLHQPLSANRALACGLSAPSGCGILNPKSVGVIVDEDRFRIDLFVAPGLRSAKVLKNDIYLPAAPTTPSLVSLFGANISGSTSGGEPQFRLQNRTVAAFGANRLRTDISIERERGISFDNLVAESDRGDLRMSAGMFWVPGSDLVARRKILGGGISSQFETRRNREQFYGTPIAIFLNSPARVEVFVDDRLISSQVLSAGNRLLDTASWPAGSYDALIRIHEQGQPVREEQRFFSRDETLAPLGHPTFQVFGGVFSNDASLEKARGFLHGAVAYRVNRNLGVRAMAIAVREKVIGDVSATLVTPVANLTAGALGSSAGDAGFVVRGYTTALKGVSASLDLRKVHTEGDAPLLPQSHGARTYDQNASSSFDQGDFLQLTGQLSARLKKATVRFSGYFRRSPSSANSYSYGPSMDLPVVRSSRFNIVAEGEAQKSDAGFKGYVGLRLLLTDGPRALAARGGIDVARDQKPRLRGEVQGSVYGETGNTRWSGNAAVGTADSSTYARAGAEVRSPMMNGRGEVLTALGGDTQYTLTAETGFVFSDGRAALSGGEMRDSAVIVETDGDNGETLDVFVNQAKAGTTSVGRPLTIYLEPYREYEVQARPHDAALLSTDFSPKKIVSYPGSVTRASWSVAHIFVAFGRLINEAGAPVRGASISGAHGVAESDEQGYFQIEMAPTDDLVAELEGRKCALPRSKAEPTTGFLKWGDVVCG